jgi:UDP-N-acetylglucosamine--N-acetylmuramyl-(pentapeptide) pyrophosphoryl-undecaprenol N-acetylglucosamine transferase
MKIACVGGHLTPALAVIDALPSDTELIFIGRKSSLEGDKANSLEYDIITKKNIPFIPLSAGRVQRKFTKHSFNSLAKVPYGFLQSLTILLRYRPDVVLSFGGYLSVPVGLAAFVLHIPLIIHEQTLEAGLANKFLARFAKSICISWRQSGKFFPKSKIIFTGNPIRIFNKHTNSISLLNEEKDFPLIYITGGSTGAHAINTLVRGCLTNILERCRIIHQTGDAQEFHDFQSLVTLKNTLPKKLQKRYYLAKFIQPYDVGAIMDEASLIVSRSGINTISELLFFSKPCFLIPIPYGQRNEQLKNAQFMKKVGIGEYMIQKELNTHLFLFQIENMLTKRAKYLAQSKEAKSLIHADAADQIIRVIYEVVSKKT